MNRPTGLGAGMPRNSLPLGPRAGQAGLPPASPANYAAAIPPAQGQPVMPPQAQGVPMQGGIPPQVQPGMPPQMQGGPPPMPPMPSPQMMQRANVPMPAPMDGQRAAMAQRMATGQPPMTATRPAAPPRPTARTAMVERAVAPAAPAPSQAADSFRSEWSRLSAEERRARLQSRRPGNSRRGYDGGTNNTKTF